MPTPLICYLLLSGCLFRSPTSFNWAATSLRQFLNKRCGRAQIIIINKNFRRTRTVERLSAATTGSMRKRNQQILFRISAMNFIADDRAKFTSGNKLSYLQRYDFVGADFFQRIFPSKTHGILSAIGSAFMDGTELFLPSTLCLIELSALR